MSVKQFGKSNNIIDFSNCKLSNKFYGGSESKIGIIYNNEPYILKFAKIVNSEVTLGYISEYIGSHIFELLGVPVHQTLLGIYSGENVVALKDFTGELNLQEFNNIGESSLDSSNNAENHLYEYSEILSMIYNNKKLLNKDLLIEIFWRMFVIDSIIGNFDRHGYNWGYLRDKSGNYTLSPVYDNGSCLFPRLKEVELLDVLNNEQKLKDRTFKFPTSQIKLDGKKSSYYEIIRCGMFKDCDKAVIWIYNNINFNDIDDIISNTPFITETRKFFYKSILRYRFENIIQSRYYRITRGEQ